MHCLIICVVIQIIEIIILEFRVCFKNLRTRLNDNDDIAALTVLAL